MASGPFISCCLPGTSWCATGIVWPGKRVSFHCYEDSGLRKCMVPCWKWDGFSSPLPVAWLMVSFTLSILKGRYCDSEAFDFLHTSPFTNRQYWRKRGRNSSKSIENEKSNDEIELKTSTTTSLILRQTALLVQHFLIFYKISKTSEAYSLWRKSMTSEILWHFFERSWRSSEIWGSVCRAKMVVWNFHRIY